MRNAHWATMGEQLSDDGRELVQAMFHGASGSVASAMSAGAMNAVESGEATQPKTLADILNEQEQAK